MPDPAVRARILDAAAEEFMTVGYDAASMDGVARRMGQTKGVLYYHFPSKLAVFKAVYEEGLSVVTGLVTTAAAGAGDGRERLTRMAAAHVADLLERLAFHDVLRQGLEHRLRQRLTEDERVELLALRERRDAYEGVFRRMVVEGVRDGSIRDVPPVLATRTLIGAMNAMVLWHRSADVGVEPAADALPAVVADLLVRGLDATTGTA